MQLPIRLMAATTSEACVGSADAADHCDFWGVINRTEFSKQTSM
jgi:hypothetical protein